MTTFHSDVVSIYAPTIGALIEFTNGAYSTDDPREIDLLRRHRDVTETVTEGLTRDELNAKAREAGVENPEKLPNKGSVLEAIEHVERDADSSTD